MITIFGELGSLKTSQAKPQQREAKKRHQNRLHYSERTTFVPRNIPILRPIMVPQIT
ncbi:hypothetical protein HanRHA438_Chr04g0195211 [Helianthus annuus]|nr:hypothetical protein HanRHA438_Chr04g0195211 [Helianthus annuus]